jgi:hypothetical protein
MNTSSAICEGDNREHSKVFAAIMGTNYGEKCNVNFIAEDNRGSGVICGSISGNNYGNLVTVNEVIYGDNHGNYCNIRELHGMNFGANCTISFPMQAPKFTEAELGVLPAAKNKLEYMKEIEKAAPKRKIIRPGTFGFAATKKGPLVIPVKDESDEEEEEGEVVELKIKRKKAEPVVTQTIENRECFYCFKGATSTIVCNYEDEAKIKQSRFCHVYLCDNCIQTHNRPCASCKSEDFLKFTLTVLKKKENEKKK